MNRHRMKLPEFPQPLVTPSRHYYVREEHPNDPLLDGTALVWDHDLEWCLQNGCEAHPDHPHPIAPPDHHRPHGASSFHPAPLRPNRLAQLVETELPPLPRALAARPTQIAPEVPNS